MSYPVLIIRGYLAKRILEEAKKLDVTVEELLIDLLDRDLDPQSRALEYIEAALDLLEQAREELERNNIRQAAEKLWGAAALAVKAYAYWREGRVLKRHGELWEYTKVLIEELGRWTYDAWMSANGIHTCFYEGWCTDIHVREAYQRIEKLVKEISTRIRKDTASQLT